MCLQQECHVGRIPCSFKSSLSARLLSSLLCSFPSPRSVALLFAGGRAIQVTFCIFCVCEKRSSDHTGSGAGSMVVQEKSRRCCNIANAALVVVVAIPALIFHFAFLYHCPGEAQHEEKSNAKLWSGVCGWGREHPLGLVNVVFFLNVDVLFWFISLAQGSTWLIDPYWTIIPVMIGCFYGTHPQARSDVWRTRAIMSLLWVWSIRLTYSYFRREDWQWGEREDWRFSQLRTQHPRHWWWMSFFAVYVSQQIFLVGICLPLYAVNSNQMPWNTWDAVAAILCGAGIVTAYFADTQLHVFMSKNQYLTDLGAPPIPVLQEGVWKYSRHPNYVGEQLWWWGLAVFAWNLQQGWMVAGTAVNSACLAYVTVLVERKMLEKPSRAAAYRRYQETTSVWIPWIKFPSATAAKKL